MYCSKCGSEIANDARFCNVCGAENRPAGGNGPANQQVPPPNYTYQNAAAGNTMPRTEAQNKVFYILAYLGILFFLPLVACPESKTGRFHANQGLVLLLTGVAGQIVLGIIGLLLPWYLWTISSLLTFAWSICILVLVIIGMMNANKGLEKGLPVIGGIRLIK